MLYGFLLSADPGHCDLASLAERYLERACRDRSVRQADAILSLYQKLTAGGRSAGA